MTVVHSLDLRAPPDDDVVRAPSNIEAEQALLGAILFDNFAYERLSDHLKAGHFYEPFHQRLFAAMEDSIRRGHLAEPILIVEKFSDDQAFHELGGLRYLADLVVRAPPAANAADYGRTIYDLALRRELLRLSGDMARNATDPALTGIEHIEAIEESLFALAEQGETSQGLQDFSVHVDLAIEAAARAYERDGALTGISTGLIDLDRKLGGLHPSDLIIIAARPSMGKTALATNIAFSAAKNFRLQTMPDGSEKLLSGARVAFFSLEMSGEQLASRILADASGVPSDRVRRGDIEAHEFGHLREARDLIRAIPLKTDDTGALPIGKLCARARRMKRRQGVDLIVIDYLQLVTVPGLPKGKDNRVQEVSAVTMALKALAKELAVPVVALSQLSRQVETREDKRPQLSDLRESGSIEQDADVVMFLYREAYYLGRAEPREGTAEHMAWQETLDKIQHEAECIIGKQRHGPIGTIKLSFNADLTKFGNLAREGRYDFATKPINFAEPRGGQDE